jgi:hypothetical protein
VKPLRIASLAVLTIVGAWVVYTFAPASFAFYPRCPFNVLTGLQCPGCGSTRALHELLHGHVGAAFRLNPMLFALIPFGMAVTPAFLRGRTPRFLMQPWFAWASFIVLTSYWIVRNTPIYPF